MELQDLHSAFFDAKPEFFSLFHTALTDIQAFHINSGKKTLGRIQPKSSF